MKIRIMDDRWKVRPTPLVPRPMCGEKNSDGDVCILNKGHAGRHFARRSTGGYFHFEETMENEGENHE